MLILVRRINHNGGNQLVEINALKTHFHFIFTLNENQQSSTLTKHCGRNSSQIYKQV